MSEIVIGSGKNLRSLLLAKKGKLAKLWISSILVWIFCLFWFSPILWMFVTSLKPSMEATTEAVPSWFPSNATLQNYAFIFSPASGISVMEGIKNSVIIALFTIIFTVVLSVPAAYALSRLRFSGKMSVFWSYVAILAFPAILFLVPNFFIVHILGMMDSFSALIIPGLGGTFGVFMLRQFMMGISTDLEDAAWIDGCSKFRFLVMIVVPFVKPALIILTLMTFIGSWNNFLWPLLVMNSPDKLPLPVILARLNTGWGDPFRGIGVLMAGAFLSTLPTLAIFIGFHRYLMEGVSIGSVGK